MSWIEWLADFLGAGQYDSHSLCLTNDLLLISVYTAGDLVIWASYMVISAGLLICRQRGIIPRPVAFDLFASFIMACGMTHFVKVVTLYTGIYRLDVMVTLATAVVSGFTAFFTVLGTTDARLRE
jgi:hypothetical protein